MGAWVGTPEFRTIDVVVACQREDKVSKHDGMSPLVVLGGCPGVGVGKGAVKYQCKSFPFLAPSVLIFCLHLCYDGRHMAWHQLADPRSDQQIPAEYGG